MKHLRHLIAADTRRVALVVAVWIVVVVASTVVDGVRPLFAADPRLGQALGVIAGLLSPVTALLMFVLIALVIHAHPAVGTDAFWMTRPIPPGALLAGKLVLLGTVLVAVPVLAKLVLMIALGVPAPLAVAIASESFLSWTLTMLLLTAGAVLTSSLARFALLCGGFLMAVAAAFAITIAIVIARFQETPSESFALPREDHTGWLIVSVLAIAAMLALVTLQYRTRRRVVSVAGGAIGVVAAIVISSYWPWPFLVVEPRVPAWATEPSSLGLQLQPDSVTTRFWRRILGPSPVDWREVRGEVVLSGAAPGWTAEIALAQASLRTDAGVITSVAGPPTLVRTSLGSPQDFPTRAAVRELLGATSVGQWVPEQLEWPVLFLLRQSDFERHPGARGQYRGRFHVLLTHYEIEGVMPLRSGASHRSDHFSVVLGRIAVADAHLELTAREWQARSSWERRPMAMYTYYLRNARRREAVGVSEMDVTSGAPIWTALPFFGNMTVGRHPGSGFRTRGLFLTLPSQYGLRGEPLSVNEAWLTDAELVVVRQTREGSVERELSVADFSFGTPAQAGTTAR